MTIDRIEELETIHSGLQGNMELIIRTKDTLKRKDNHELH